MKIDIMIRELQKAQEAGIHHVVIKDNKIYESLGVDDSQFNKKLIPGKKIFPLPQDSGISKSTGKVPGDDMGEFARYSWDSDKGESGLFKYHYDKMREKDWDDPLGESKESAKNILKEQFKRLR